MAHLIIRHKVADFAKWKTAFDAHADARRKAGSRGGTLYRSADNPNETLIVLEWDSVANARKFTQSGQRGERAEVHAVVRPAGDDEARGRRRSARAVLPRRWGTREVLTDARRAPEFAGARRSTRWTQLSPRRAKPSLAAFSASACLPALWSASASSAFARAS